MTLQTTSKEISEPAPTYEQVLSLRQNIQWKALESHIVEDAIAAWLETLSSITAKNYRSGMAELSKRGLLCLKMTLQAFSMANHEAIVDRIKTEPKDWAEATRQARAAAYISFTAFLDRRLHGMTRKAKPNREESNRTFYKIREKVQTQAMSYSQWQVWLRELEKINRRDYLMAKVALQGAKRIAEVLALTTEQIDWELCQIAFKQSKTKGTAKQTVITYPKGVVEEIRRLVDDRKGLVFTTSRGKSVSLGQVAKTFAKAGALAGIAFKVTPHVLRASAITFFKQSGLCDSDIMKVSGHLSCEMVNAYDKSGLAENASRRISLVE